MNDFGAIAEGAQVLHVHIGQGDIVAHSAETGWALEWSGDEAPIIERDGQVLRVKQREDFWRGHLNVWLTLPPGIEFVELQDGVGRVEISGLACPVKVRTGSGNVQLAQHTGGADLHTGKGTIEVSDSDGMLSIDSGYGNIRLTNVGENAQAKTGKGNITITAPRNLAAEIKSGYGNLTVEGGSVRNLTFKTGKGSVTCIAQVQPGSYEFESGMGGVDIGLPASVNARVEAITGSGGVQSDFALVRVGRSGPMGFGGGGRMVGSIGEGDATTFVTIKTGMGGITIRRLGVAEPVPAYAQQPAYSSASIQQAEPRIVDAATSVTPAPAPNLTLVILESLARGEISPAEADALLTQVRQRS